jgi:hypothetical protein
MRPLPQSPIKQNGSVAVIVGVSLAVLVGFAGLALDLGRLYVNKTELQNAADACALAAASELICDTSVLGACPASYLQHAENAGMFAAAQNRRDFQETAVAIAASDIQFSTALASGYMTRAGGASPASKYARCTTHGDGLVPWFMGVLGVGASNVTATAVATLAPAQSFCSNAPMGICKKAGTGSPNYGYAIGEWITASFKQNDESIVGSFRWVDFTPSAGGTNEVRDQLASTNGVCSIRVGDNVEEPGLKQGVKHAYNTRFGLYSNGSGYDVHSAPPDRTGYAYPNKNDAPLIGIGTSAYSDYRNRQGTYATFDDQDNAKKYAGDKVPNSKKPTTSQQHQQFGSERRLVTVPVVDCANKVEPILGMACALMLNPMPNGNGDFYLEYRGSANVPGSPCRTAGIPGDASGKGPQVPTLVQ